MCTNINITTTNNEYVNARSQEFSYELDSKLLFRKKGAEFVQKLSKTPDILHKWTGKYGFTGMNAFDLPVVVDGMNTEGLATGGMWFNNAVYPGITDGSDKTKISVFYICEWILSNFATCDEVVKELEINKLEIADTDTMKHHFPVQDALGNKIVIEFIDGKVVVSENPLGVLTNQPELQWHLTNMRNYRGITPYDVDEPTQGNFYPNNVGLGKVNMDNLGGGGGFAQVPGSWQSADRFIRMAMISNYADRVDTLEEATTLAVHFLNTVDIPQGVVRDNKNDVGAIDPFIFKKYGIEVIKQNETTQYISIKNLTEKIYSVRMYESPLLYSVKLNELDLDELDGTTVEIPQQQSIDLTQQINEGVLSSGDTIQNLAVLN
ncbi:MAG: linear amide C-N hydrolase [Magnetovibrio sp.]|nr:linear amide C-N hydrolase [Magnetovibrio sp.]